MRVNSNDTDWDIDGLVTYEGRPYTGEVIETDRTGRLRSSRFFVGGLQNGLEQRWHPNGVLSTELVMDMGKLIGVAREWHENGQLASERRYNSYGEEASITRWDEDGVPATPPGAGR